MMVLALQLILWVAAQSPDPASVEGVVLESGTSAPIRDVTLQLWQTTNSAVRYTAISSQDGRFVFRAVAPGEYSLIASRAGYVRAQYGQRGPKGAASTLSLKAATPVTNVALSMMRGAAISGRVYDRNGIPAMNAQLHALKISYQTGWRLAVPVVSQMTNDRGEYRLFGLSPGVYYVSAQAESLSHIRSPSMESLPPVAPGVVVTKFSPAMTGGIVDPAAQRQTPQTEWAPVYFGGGTDQSSAAPIVVRPGSDIAGVDIVVDRKPLATISGSATATSRENAGAASVVMTSALNPIFHAMPQIMVTGGAMIVSPTAPARTGIGGAFTMRSVPPGLYTLTAIAGTPDGNRLSGQVSIKVEGGPSADTLNINVSMSPAWNVSGRVIVDGGQDGVETLSIRAVSTINPIADVLPAQVSNDGGFVLRNVAHGNYIVTIAPLSTLMKPDAESAVPGGWRNAYIKSITLGEVDVLNDGLRLDRAPERPMEIVISRNAGTLNGSVTDESGRAAANVRVALLPDQARRARIDLYRSAMTDANGRYRIERIPPGSYKVFAWEDVELNAWHDPAFMRVYEDSGATAAVREGADQTVNVTAISPLR